MLDDLQTGKVFRSAISTEAFFVFPLWKFRAEPSHAFGIPNCVTPHVFRIQVQEPPLSIGIPRCCPWYGMNIFWNYPMVFACFDMKEGT